jgi:hypothetical protein
MEQSSFTMINYVQPMPTDKPKWIRDDRFPFRLSCYDVKHGFWGSDDLLSKIQDWSKDNKCGKRTSYENWDFKTEQDMMRFLLRWG